MSLKEDHELISNDHRVRVATDDGECFAAHRHGCLRPAAWTFEDKAGCTPHIATLVRRKPR
jgi:hypothetical protein